MLSVHDSTQVEKLYLMQDPDLCVLIQFQIICCNICEVKFAYSVRQQHGSHAEFVFFH